MKPLSGQLNIFFDGRTYVPAFDRWRLAEQLRRTFELMKDGSWRTLNEISRSTGDLPQSVSARLRDLRKSRFGKHTVERRRAGNPEDGYFEYRLVLNGGHYER